MPEHFIDSHGLVAFMPVSPGGGVHDLQMDGGLPPGSQEGNLS